MNSYDIRKKFQAYFTTQNHKWAPSSSLIPKKDSGLLFTNAGMNQFKDFFLGIKSPPHPQICSIQKCLRAGGKHNDLEQVGHSPFHHTFFEMMGFFSFGGYRKKQAIDHAMSFLTKELGIPKDRLWVSVFKEDKESAEIWRRSFQIPLEKIFALSEKDNFWRMGDIGPCGPCSEVYYYDGPKKDPAPEDMIEIWNLVFMEFNESNRGRTPLPKLCIDTGMGLERLAAVLQGAKSNYHIDLFKEIIQYMEKISGIKYNFTNISQDEDQVAFRVIADHSRAISFLICDGVLPGSEGASYVLRRILRRALFYNSKLLPNKNLLCSATDKVVNSMSSIYPELNQNKKLINSIIREEENLFTQSLNTGRAVLLQKIKNLQDKKITNATVWDLYSTYGFPPDLTRLIAKEKGFEVSELGLEDLKKQFHPSSLSEKSLKKNQKDTIALFIKAVHIFVGPNRKTEFTGHTKNKEVGQILFTGYIKKLFQAETHKTNVASTTKLEFIAPLEKGQEGFLILNRTCLYPEGGGPIGDKGTIRTETGEAEVLDSQKKGNFIFHKVKVLKGELKKRQACEVKVNAHHRRLIAAGHSATHLLHQTLKTVLGDSVRQMGSLVKPGELRFDFSYPKPLSYFQIEKIEKTVMNHIQANHSVLNSIQPYEEAINKGALFLSGENYEEKVRTIKMGDSFELCGGIHVNKTAEIGGFKIISESGVQSGVRRITAYTSDILQGWYELMKEQNKQLRKYLQLAIPEKPEPVNPFIQWFTDKEEEIKSLTKQLRMFLINKSSEKKKRSPNNIKTPAHTEPKEQNFLVHQNEELRKYLHLPPVKTLTENKDYFLPFIRKKEEQTASLKKQLKNLSTSLSGHELRKKTKPFQHQGIKGHLLNISLPIEDRKILAEITDQIKHKMATPLVIVILGAGDAQYPLVISVSKELQKYISAGNILKNTIAPFLEGKGGGQARFAQGTVKNKNRFPKLEETLLKTLNS